MSLYDALYLYGLALHDVYEETKAEDAYKDGEKIWKKMADRQYEGTFDLESFDIAALETIIIIVGI